MPIHNTNEGKQRRKAYALFFIREHSEITHRARRTYRLALSLVLLFTFIMCLVLVLTGRREEEPCQVLLAE
jgi:hypothetical protein